MTKLTYILYDGTKTSSYVEALATGKGFTRSYEPIKTAVRDPERVRKVIMAIREKVKNRA